MEEIRWKQRFQNLRFAFGQLCEFMEAGELNKFETQGLVKCFEYTFELSWKTLKDFLEEEGFSDIKSPRDTIKQAFQSGYLIQGRLWLEALEKRNLMSHTYNEEIKNEVVGLIREKYFQMISELVEFLNGKPI
jgi:nucleotidyltransferase substrate binding protein (TIGR01987 family)